MHLFPLQKFSLILVSIGLLAPGSLANAEIPPNVVNYMKAYCAECHNPQALEGDFSLTYLKPAVTPEDAEYWQLVLDNLHLGDMPPRKAKQPDIKETEPVTAWIEQELERARKSLAGHTSEVVLRRLNITEYENTIYDLFAVQGDFTTALPEDTKEEGFDNIGAALMLSSTHIDQYMAAADFILGRAIQEESRPEEQIIDFSLRALQEKEDERHRKRVARQKGIEPEEVKLDRSGPYYPPYGQDALIPMGRIKPDTRHFLNSREPGWYEFQVTAYPVWNEDKTMLLKVQTTSNGRGEIPELIDLIELSEPDQPVTKSYRVFLEPRHYVQLEMVNGPRHVKPEELDTNQEPRIAIGEMKLSGPLFEQWPPRGHQLLLGDLQPSDLTDELVPDLIANLAPTLFRRPVDSSIVEEFAGYYRQQREFENEIEAYQSTVKAMMVSPFFLFHLEPAGQVDPYALASRLSYFLWRSAPDEQLYEAAADGSLSEFETLVSQVNRMLANPKSERFISDFVGQWLETEMVGEIQPDENLYPEYDEALERAMAEETRLFIREMLLNDLPINNLVDSDWTMLNERLANHYNIPGVEGTDFRKVRLNKEQTVRGGLLTHASILNVTSNGTTTSPIIRGVWMLDRLLGTPAPPPPPDVPAIEPDIRGATTIQEQLAAHRDIPQCASCHEKIDPFGLALENFDVIGGWRENYRALEGSGRRSKLIDGQPISSDGELPNLGQFENFQQFRKILRENEHFVYQNMAEQLSTYALGRALDFSDREQIKQIVQLTRQHGGGLRTMVHAVVQSPLFQKP